MSLARQYIWVLVIVGMIFSSLVICIIFLLINRCISRRGKHRILQLHRPSDSKAGSNMYQEKAPNDGTPPLPPRTQFLTAEVLDDVHDYEECPEPLPGSMKADQETELRHPAAFYSHPAQKMKPGVVEAFSYENLAEEHDYEESTEQPDYIKVEDETEAFPAPPTYMKPDPKMKPGVVEALSYENLAEEHDYEESTEQPDYIKVEDETEAFPAPPTYMKPDPKMKPGVVEALSYENLAEEHDYEESTDQPDYIKVEDETEAFPAPPFYMKPDLKMIPGVIEALSYENLAEEPDYEQSLDDQPDYMKVEDEEALLTNPVDPEDDNASSEDYDDIGGGDGHETQDDDDYDDVA